MSAGLPQLPGGSPAGLWPHVGAFGLRKDAGPRMSSWASGQVVTPGTFKLLKVEKQMWSLE